MTHKHDEIVHLREVLGIVLLFYTASHWTDIERREWKRITGSDEATTKVLADTIRGVLDEDFGL